MATKSEYKQAAAVVCGVCPLKGKNLCNRCAVGSALDRIREMENKTSENHSGMITYDKFLDGYRCIGHLCCFFEDYIDIDRLFGYRYWLFQSEKNKKDYLVAWDCGNGWYGVDYLKYDNVSHKELKSKIFHDLFDREYACFKILDTPRFDDDVPVNATSECSSNFHLDF